MQMDSKLPLKHESKANPKNITYQQVLKEIIEFFNYDKDKALVWYMTKNPLLGDISPFEMVKIGKGQKLMKFIRSQLDGNHP